MTNKGDKRRFGCIYIFRESCQSLVGALNLVLSVWGTCGSQYSIVVKGGLVSLWSMYASDHGSRFWVRLEKRHLHHGGKF